MSAIEALQAFELARASLSTLKVLIETEKGFDKAAAKNELVDVLLKMADLKDEIVSVRDENARLRATVSDLREAAESYDAYKPYARTCRSYMYLVQPDDLDPSEQLDAGPYCKACWANGHRVSALVSQGGRDLLCSVCDTATRVTDNDNPLKNNGLTFPKGAMSSLERRAREQK